MEKGPLKVFQFGLDLSPIYGTLGLQKAHLQFLLHQSTAIFFSNISAESLRISIKSASKPNFRVYKEILGIFVPDKIGILAEVQVFFSSK